MSKEKQKIYKPKAISGFPEWLPELRRAEQKWFDHIRKTFESYGYASIETPSVEEIDVLLAKGEVDKEIYVIDRLHKDEDDSKEARLALHFDQTVPFARYTAQHFNELTFPFKRYQMQRVWRGERPQMGRQREFYQCDIDVIGIDNLSLSYDAEMVAVAYEALQGLGIGGVQVRISNRKILMGLLGCLGINEKKLLTKDLESNDPLSFDIHTKIIRIIDKLDKVGTEEVDKQLLEIGVNLPQIRELAEIKASPSKFSGLLLDFITRNDVIARSDSDAAIQLLEEGISELQEVLESLSHLPDGAVVADLSIVRGLDYYTGTVYETVLTDVEGFTSSICSGGRYDDLASQYINKKLPGVGISIGFSRLFDVIRQTKPEWLDTSRKCPTDILVYTEHKELKSEATQTAQTLRQRGFNVEIFETVKKWDKHAKYAANKGIPHIWYVKESGHEVKNMARNEKSSATPDDWTIDA